MKGIPLSLRCRLLSAHVAQVQREEERFFCVCVFIWDAGRQNGWAYTLDLAWDRCFGVAQRAKRSGCSFWIWDDWYTDFFFNILPATAVPVDFVK